MGLLGENGRVTAGEVTFDGQPLLSLTPEALDRVRGNTLTMIFQDAMSSLNPVLTIGRQMTEAIRAHLPVSEREVRARAARLLTRVGLSLPQRLMYAYPHTLSGGMRQRVMIAMALCCEPRLLIADEPTTALDVTIQAQIMRLLADLRREFGMALLLITHDMGLVAEMADRVLVMYAGQVVEEADVHTLFAAPRHPYTRALLRSVPSIRDGAQRRLHAIRGTVPEAYQALPGCRFYNRCEQALPACQAMAQPLCPLGGGAAVRCWRAADGAWADASAAQAAQDAQDAHHALDALDVQNTQAAQGMHTAQAADIAQGAAAAQGAHITGTVQTTQPAQALQATATTVAAHITGTAQAAQAKQAAQAADASHAKQAAQAAQSATPAAPGARRTEGRPGL